MSQSAFIMVDPSARRRRQHPKTKWEGLKDKILEIYKTNTLSDLRRIMLTEHNFDATDSEYKLRFQQWNVRKYFNKSERRFMLGHLDSAEGLKKIPKFLSTRDWEYVDPQRVRNLRKHKYREALSHRDAEPNVNSGEMQLLAMPQTPSPTEPQFAPVAAPMDLDVEEIVRVDQSVLLKNKVEYHINLRLPQRLTADDVIAFAQRIFECLKITTDFRHTTMLPAQKLIAMDSVESDNGSYHESCFWKTINSLAPLSPGSIEAFASEVQEFASALIETVQSLPCNENATVMSTAEAASSIEKIRDSHIPIAILSEEDDSTVCETNQEVPSTTAVEDYGVFDEWGRFEPDPVLRYQEIFEVDLESSEVLRRFRSNWGSFYSRAVQNQQYLERRQQYFGNVEPFLWKEVDPQVFEHPALEELCGLYAFYRACEDRATFAKAEISIVLLSFMMDELEKLGLEASHPWRLRARYLLAKHYPMGSYRDVLYFQTTAFKGKDIDILQDTSRQYETIFGPEHYDTRECHRMIGLSIAEQHCPGRRSFFDQSLDLHELFNHKDQILGELWKALSKETQTAIEQGGIFESGPLDVLEVDTVLDLFNFLVTLATHTDPSETTVDLMLNLSRFIVVKEQRPMYFMFRNILSLATRLSELNVPRRGIQNVPGVPTALQKYISIIREGYHDACKNDVDKLMCNVRVALISFKIGDVNKSNEFDPSALFRKERDWASRLHGVFGNIGSLQNLARLNAAPFQQNTRYYALTNNRRAMECYEAVLRECRLVYGETDSRTLSIIDEIRIFLDELGLGRRFLKPLTHYYIKGYEERYGPQDPQVMRSIMEANAAAFRAGGLIIYSYT